MKKLIIFDFDGTLVDTITDVGLCFNEALFRCGFPQHPIEAFGGFAGGNLETVVSKLLPAEARSKENIDAVKTVYRQCYLHSGKPNTAPYPGIMELLEALKYRGIKLAVNSNKGQVLLDDMVEKIFPSEFFDAVVGYLETRPSKPDPFGVELILQKTACAVCDAVYVGDGASDIATARNAGMDMAFVSWGQGSPIDERDPYCRWRCRSAAELAAVLLGGKS